MAYRVEVDAGDVRFSSADESDVDDASVFRTLAEAKREALRQAVPERDSWAQCVRSIRSATRYDVLGDTGDRAANW